jgi:hypothetical protein
MSARKDMEECFRQWLALTLAEATAIESSAWSRVSEIQAGKAELQKTILVTQDRWAKEVPHGADSPGANPFRVEIGRLISLESRNGELLAAQLRRARVRQETVDQAQRNLNKIRGSYAYRPPAAVLQCYS